MEIWMTEGGIQHAMVDHCQPHLPRKLNRSIWRGSRKEPGLLADLIGVLNESAKRHGTLEWLTFYSKIDPSFPRRKKKVQTWFAEWTKSEKRSYLPILGVVSRLYQQKGLDLLLEIIPPLWNNPIAIAILGRRPPQEKAFEKFSQKYPNELNIDWLMMVWQDDFGGSDFS